MKTSTQNPRLAFFSSLLIGITAALPVMAQAGEPVRVPRLDGSFVVNYSDLDLSDPAAVNTLYARLENAARDACSNHLAPVGQRSSVAFRDCYNNALSQAVKRVNSQQLLAVHAERGRKTTIG